MIRNMILVLLMLTVIASVHEAGHMLTARAFGAGVIEYAVGIGPALIKRRIGGTLYSLRVLPLGGFCRLKDIDEKDCDKTKGRCLRDLPHWQQALVMLAGPLSNLALALAVCTLSVLIYGYYPPEISSVPEGGAAYGILQEGDLITSIDGHRTRMLEDASELIASSEDGTVTVGFERDGRPMTAAIRMKETEEGRKLGIVFALDRKRCSPAGILPCGLEVISLERLLPQIRDGAPVLGGLADSETVSLFESAGHPFEDYFKRRELTVRNCIPTAEGALMIAMQEQAETVFGSSVLVIGFGNVGKASARLFAAAGAEVSCAVRRADAAAEAESAGYAPLMMPELAESISRFDTVINTVPALVLDEPLLEAMKPKALIIDLASLPGGVDKAAAEALGVRLVHALALPGKVAPVTAGRYIADTVTNILTERGVGNVT